MTEFIQAIDSWPKAIVAAAIVLAFAWVLGKIFGD